MSQQSHTEKNGSTATDDAAGVTAVLDSMIRTTDRRERTTEQPLRAKQSASPEVAVDVRGASTAPAAKTKSSTKRSAKLEGTKATTAPAKTKTALPEPAVRVRYSEFDNLGQPTWSVAGAAALGLPARFLDAFEGLTDADETDWMSTMVELVAPLCTGAPDIPTMLVASETPELAEALGLPVYRPRSLPPYGGSIFCTVDNDETHFAWLSRVRGDRALHVVLGGSDADWLTFHAPTAISYTTNRGALEALKLADASGAAIAFGTNALGAPIRVTAFELALAIRSLLRTR